MERTTLLLFAMTVLSPGSSSVTQAMQPYRFLAWRHSLTFIMGRDEIVTFLQQKWQKESEYRLIKELWAYTENRIAVRFTYEWHDEAGQWFRSSGNENWKFGDDGLMQNRIASINDLAISEDERKYH